MKAFRRKCAAKIRPESGLPGVDILAPATSQERKPAAALGIGQDLFRLNLVNRAAIRILLDFSGTHILVEVCLRQLLGRHLLFLSSKEAQRVESALNQKGSSRNERVLGVFPYCTDEYSTRPEFLDAVFGSTTHPLIDPNTRVFTLGSCFARNIAHYLNEKGYRATPFVQSEDLNSPFSNAQMLAMCSP